MHAEKMNATMLREACRRAGRPGLCIGAHMSVAPRAIIGACNPKYIRQCDCITCWLVVNMKVDYDTFCKAEHYRDYGCRYYGSTSTLIGGAFGGVEGAAIGAVAEALASYMAHHIDNPHIWPIDSIYPPGMAARKPMWASSLALAALARHSNFVCIGYSPYQAYAGPCTEMYLHEIAATAVAVVVCGGHTLVGGGRCGTETDYFGGPLDARFLRDVAYAATKLKRKQANEIVKAILAKYEDRIKAKNPPIGKKFQECNDLKTLKPTKEYLELYEKVKKELAGLGLEFE